MRKTLLFSLALVMLPKYTCAADSEVSAVLNQLAKDLVTTYKAAYTQQQQHTTLAVLPFHAEEALTKRKVGDALAELLMHSFRKYPEFTLVERVDLNRVFSELKLGMSGIVDPEEVMQIGKLSGASLQVFGSIEKIGSKYHINARMVQTETGNIVATAIKTVPASLFDEEAKYYLTEAPVPKTQALGVYIGYILRKSYSEANASTTNDAATGSQVGSDGPKTAPLSYAIGLRYDVFPRIQLGYLYSVQTYTLNVYSTAPNGYSSQAKTTVRLRNSRLLIAYKSILGKYFNSYTAAGVSMITRQNVDGLTFAKHSSPNEYELQSVTLANTTKPFPVVSQRFEYRPPQSRLALGLAFSCELAKIKYLVIDLQAGRFSPFYIEPTLGFYF